MGTLALSQSNAKWFKMVTHTIRNSEESLDFHSYAVSKNTTIHSRTEVKTLKINKKETHLEPS